MRNQVENCYPYVVLYSQWVYFYSEVCVHISEIFLFKVNMDVKEIFRENTSA